MCSPLCPKKWNRLSLIRWKTGGLRNSGFGNLSGIQDPEDFTEIPCVKGIQLPSMNVASNLYVSLNIVIE